MYKSGQRINFDFDTTPLTFDLNAPLSSEIETTEDEEEEDDFIENSASKFDYNYLME